MGVHPRDSLPSTLIGPEDLRGVGEPDRGHKARKGLPHRSAVDGFVGEAQKHHDIGKDGGDLCVRDRCE